MTNAWDAVRAAIDAEDFCAVATLLATYDDVQRREVAHKLPDHLPIAQQAGQRRDHEREARLRERWEELEREAARLDRYWFDLPEAAALEAERHQERDRWIEPMRVAGAGALASAAAVVTWLNKPDLTRPRMEEALDDVPAIVRLVAARPAAWGQGLAVRLAQRLRGARPDRDDRRIRLALALLRSTGAEPPAHDPLTFAWVATHASTGPVTASTTYPAADPATASIAGPTAAPVVALAADPLLEVMVSRLFEAEGVGRQLRNDRHLAAALAALAADGVLKRAALLDGCRTRFLRGGEGIDLRFFVRLHEALAPSPEEITPHAGDYVALLSHGPANVADLALRVLRTVDVTPPAEAVEGLLYRREGRLVQAGLTLLERALKGPACSLDAYTPALVVALLCESAEARGRAVKLLLKHAARFGPEAVESIKDTVAMLPAGHGAELAGMFGGQVAPEPEKARFVPVALPAAPEVARMPEPVGEAGTLVRRKLSEFEWLESERWLDGFVRLMGSGQRDEVAAVLAPLAEHKDITWWHPADWVAAIAAELVEPGAEHNIGRSLVAYVPDMTYGSADKLVPLLRFRELYQALAGGRMPPYLLATPTHVNGLLEAGTLVERMEGYERAGVTPLPLDLRQALLRVSRTVDSDMAARAARLTSEAGRRVCEWLTDRPAEPEVVLRWAEHEGDTRIWSDFVTGPAYAEVIGDILVERWHEESCGRLLAVFTGHRELAAARSAYALLSTWPMQKPRLDELELLALADGPGGPGLALLLAYYLADGPETGGVRPLLYAVASGGLPGVELGRQLAVLLRRGHGTPAGTMKSLRAAAWSGAHREVWEVMTGLLAAYLPGPGERATPVHTRLMSFAAEVASWADARGEVAVVTELAGRKRTSELVRQARSLHARLTAAPAIEDGIPAAPRWSRISLR